MGVPAFYRWLADKYSLAVVDVVEEKLAVIDGVTIPLDTTKPNPNGIEFDNLYLDMNGIIHPCFHPEDGPCPTSFDEVFLSIFNYIDRLFGMVRPRKLLYMAVDGVAPRAKMNQQRSRRFRSAKDALAAEEAEEELRNKFEREGRKLPPKEHSEVFDSNIITPGTKFMAMLSVALQYYIHQRLNHDHGWKQIKALTVILSDANVPGEGEHKIMSYIRSQRNLPMYNPNTRHCLYGLDADLIMLGLATHEVHFSILREVVFAPGHQEKCYLCGKLGHLASNCLGKAKITAGEFDEQNDESTSLAKKPYQFINLWILREYLELEMTIIDPPVEIDFECFVDDFVFMCFFAGNDFLPNMPTLEIREGAVNLLLAVYKKEFKALGGYLTDGSKPNLSRVERFIQAVGSYEEKIFLKRMRLQQRQLERIKREMQKRIEDDEDTEYQLESAVPAAELHCSRLSCYKQTGTNGPLDNLTSCREQLYSSDNNGVHKVAHLVSESTVNAPLVDAGNNHKEVLESTMEFKGKLKMLLREKSDAFNSEKPVVDMIKLGEPGWRERYYKNKFSVETADEVKNLRKDLVLKYAEGLCWVMHYYYEGVCSWQWFYPYHYAPFASDLKGLGQLKISFQLGSPFKPLSQLLGVFPAESSHALPEVYRKLMTDPSSPVIDFYPPDFKVDMDGKRFSWQGVAKLPFIDEKRLLAEVKKIEHTLSGEELCRNGVMQDKLFVLSSHSLSSSMYLLENSCKQLSESKRAEVKEMINPWKSDGMNGYVSPCIGDSHAPLVKSPVAGLEDVKDNHVICSTYVLPDAHKHITRPLPDVIFPEKTVHVEDLTPEPVLWHEDFPRKPLQNARHNPTGNHSGRQLGGQAHRFIANSLHLQMDRISIGNQIDSRDSHCNTGRPNSHANFGCIRPRQPMGMPPRRPEYNTRGPRVPDPNNLWRGRSYSPSGPPPVNVSNFPHQRPNCPPDMAEYRSRPSGPPPVNASGFPHQRINFPPDSCRPLYPSNGRDFARNEYRPSHIYPSDVRGFGPRRDCGYRCPQPYRTPGHDNYQPRGGRIQPRPASQDFPRGRGYRPHGGSQFYPPDKNRQNESST